MPQTSTVIPYFDDSHRSVLPAFREWVAQELSAFRESEGGDGIDARDIFRRLGRAGWLQHCVGRETDTDTRGRRPDIRMVALIREALAYSSAIADVAFSEPWLAALPLLLYGTPEQRAHHIPKFCEGTELLSFALSEPSAGSDVAAISTTLSRVEQGYQVDGTKTWTSNSGLADGYVVFGRVPDLPGKTGITAVLVDGGRNEVVLEERLRVLSPHTVGTLRFLACPTTTCHAPEIGGLGDGFQVAMQSLELFRPTVAAACVGYARRALDEALARCRERRSFGRPIAEHQMIQAKLADMEVRINAASLLTYHAAWSADTLSPTAGSDAAIAKLYASEAAAAVVDEAVQIFGGLGVVSGNTVERLYRHVRAFRIFDGTSEIQRLIIAKSLLQLGLQPSAAA